MVLKYAATALTAAMLAAVAALGATAVEPRSADAEVGATVGATAAASCTGGNVNLSADEKRMLDLHNRARADRGLRRLCVHPDLQRAARAHSEEMVHRDRFAHGNVGQRLSQFGYRWSTYGENILYDPGSRDSTQGLFKLWMDSRGHRANILENDFSEVGIGASSGNYKGGKATMWTVDFGDR